MNHLSFALQSLAWSILIAVSPAMAADTAVKRIKLEGLEPPGRTAATQDFPVSVGLVFPQGEVRSLPGGSLVDDRGRSIPFEAEATAWWQPEKRDIKWVLLRFKASTDRHYYFQPGQPAAPVTGNPIARANGGELMVDTGRLQVRMDPKSGGLFRNISLAGKTIASAGADDLILAVDDGKQAVPVKIRDWTLVLEESTPFWASVKASGHWCDAAGKPLARVEVRCEFFQGEAFIRIYHTLTWMTKPIAAGIRELSLAIVPQVGKLQSVQIGSNELGAEASNVTLKAGSVVNAIQEDGDRFTVKDRSETVATGRRLGGWIAVNGDDGRSMAVSLRHAWQRYPAGFRVAAGRLHVELSPAAQRLSFEAEAIMGPGIYQHPAWKRVRQTYNAPGNATHFYDNYSPNPGYYYTAEGAAFTHEVVLSFHDGKTGRTPAELNSVTQHPVVLRQDPVHAMRVPFMGFTLLPHDARSNPEIERAVNQIGRMAMGRWVGPQNFGLLRFGMVRWGRHEAIENPTANFYRWMDNGQYGQQLIPWLLFLRGGDRRFFDDAEIVSRFAMDMSTNHFNTRGSPTGYIAGCGSALPFAPFGFSAGNMKMQKIHFLAYYYHLTGYRRARDVMEEVIAGTKEFTLSYEKTQRAKEPGREFYNLSNGGREMYNMNAFWANAWEESWDPEIWRLAANGRKSTIHGQYKPATNEFNGPHIYVYDGLVKQQRLSGDAATRDVMLRHLDIASLTTHGGLTCNSALEDSIGFPWAFEQTGDRRLAAAGWDIARGMADLVPDIDFLAPEVPAYYPYEYTGNSLVRTHLMPILTGVSLGRATGHRWEDPHVFRDLFFQMWRPSGQTDYRAEIFVRARQDGKLALRCLAKGVAKNPLTVEVSRADGSSVAQSIVAARPDGTPDQYTPFQQDLVVAGAKAREIFKVTMRKADAAPVAVMADAQIVHHLPPELMHSHEPLCSAQNFTPVRIVTRTTNATMSYFNRVRRAYSLRDAKTLELIFRPKLFTEKEAAQSAGRDRMIMLTSSGCRSPAEWRMTGVEPYFATRVDDWFNPFEAGWPRL